MSKVFERIICKEITTYMKAKYITGFRKSHGTHHSLIAMLGKCKSALDKGENISILFMDRSKAFDKLNHDLLLAKLRVIAFKKMCSN